MRAHDVWTRTSIRSVAAVVGVSAGRAVTGAADEHISPGCCACACSPYLRSAYATTVGGRAVLASISAPVCLVGATVAVVIRAARGVDATCKQRHCAQGEVLLHGMPEVVRVSAVAVESRVGTRSDESLVLHSL